MYASFGCNSADASFVVYASLASFALSYYPAWRLLMSLVRLGSSTRCPIRLIDHPRELCERRNLVSGGTRDGVRRSAEKGAESAC